MLSKLITIFLVISISCFAQTNLYKYSTSLDYAQVVKVQTTKRANGSWCFNVTVRHNDEGWKHYSNAWEVLDMNGNTLGTRILGHPHNQEQPFTRSQCGIEIPKNVSNVVVRAKCNKHGFGGKSYIVDIQN